MEDTMPEKGRYAFFSHEEFQQRQNKAYQLMDKYEIDAMFILQGENLCYFTGYISWLKDSKHRPFVGILAKEKDPVLVLPRLQLGDAEGFSHVEDIRLWSSDYLDFYVDTFKDLGLANKRIGVEIGHDTHLAMSLLEFEQLKSMLPDATWVDCTDLIFECRKIKSPQEIAYIRKAGELADKAVENSWKSLRAGMSEREIATIMANTFSDGGAEELGFVIIRSTPEDLYMRNKMATDRILQKGDVISCDIGCVYRRYWSDMMRAAAIGEPAKEMADGFAAAAVVNKAVREAIRPGMEIDELDQVRARTIEENNYGTWLPSIGHCLGTTVHELPRIAGGVHDILEPGMVFAVEPGVYFPPYVFNIEDVVVVTEDGYESFNNYPRELYIAE
jgi:Xaa-Pro dipeptidase